MPATSFKLSSAERTQFIEQGFVVVREAFPSSLAAEIRPLVWERIGLDEHDPSGWDRPSVHLKEFLVGEPFERVYTPRFVAAVNALLGEGRWVVPNRSGWWPVRFPGFAEGPWQPPTAGWHLDGNHRHTLTAPEQGLLGILIFSQIEKGDGGTAIRLGSHRTAAKSLAAAGPQGMDPGDISRQVTEQDQGEVLEITGSPGDVALMHPFMLHSASSNTGSRVRMITNKCFPLHQPMDLARSDPAEFSLVEQAILHALDGPVMA